MPYPSTAKPAANSPAPRRPVLHPAMGTSTAAGRAGDHVPQRQAARAGGAQRRGLPNRGGVRGLQQVVEELVLDVPAPAWDAYRTSLPVRPRQLADALDHRPERRIRRGRIQSSSTACCQHGRDGAADRRLRPSERGHAALARARGLLQLRVPAVARARPGHCPEGYVRPRSGQGFPPRSSARTIRPGHGARRLRGLRSRACRARGPGRRAGGAAGPRRGEPGVDVIRRGRIPCRCDHESCALCGRDVGICVLRNQPPASCLPRAGPGSPDDVL
jgi:hypothetical protein